MLDLYIGKVVEVSNTLISVAINKELETPYVVINSKPIRIAGVGNFLKIENSIYEIISEKTALESNNKEVSVKIASNRLVVCKVIGFFEQNEFKQGSSGETPNIFDNVYTVSDEELLKIYSGTSYNESINVGKYLYKKDLKFCIDINKFFASHSLIVGNTGSGKSNTLNTIFTELFDHINTEGSYFLFIDTNGEYSKAFTDNKSNKILDTRNAEKNSIHIPLNLLESEDWKLLLEATEKTQYVLQLEAALETLNITLKDLKDKEQKTKVILDSEIKKQKFESVEEMLGYIVTEVEISETDNEIGKYKQDVLANLKQWQQAKEDAKGKILVDVEELRLRCEEQQEAVNKIRSTVNSTKHRIDMNSEKQSNIIFKRGDLEKSDREYTICKRLYDLVRGSTSKGKITLEQYIQAAGFDGIITAANRRLLPMSDGQYELYRQESSIGKKSNNFLDLEVLDNYTGHRRPVGSLSGGESFKASLSLALGLSDTVSSNLGGIQMDALFVDEGFGTLDHKSMDSAMDALVNLSGNNKLVGIISHREELVESIPQQIKVKKSKEGSQITVEAGF
mgnify:CR=1 FL=1